MTDESIKAQRRRKSEFAGPGALVQLLGILSPVILWGVAGVIGVILGLFVMVILLLVGSRMSLKWICANCGNRIDGRHVTLCPTCKATLS